MRISDSFSPIQAKNAFQQNPAAPAVGDTIEAEVVSADGRNLTLRLPDGTELSARSDTPLAASPGGTLRLTVTGRSAQTVFVKLPDEGEDARALLRQWGAETTPQNLRLMRALLGSALVPTEKTFNRIVSALAAAPDLSPEQAVFMHEHQIPLDPQTAAFFIRLDRQELQLGDQLTQLAALIEAFPEAAEVDAASGTDLSIEANFPPAESRESVAPEAPRAGADTTAVTPEAPAALRDNPPADNAGGTVKQGAAVPAPMPEESPAPEAGRAAQLIPKNENPAPEMPAAPRPDSPAKPADNTAPADGFEAHTAEPRPVGESAARAEQTAPHKQKVIQGDGLLGHARPEAADAGERAAESPPAVDSLRQMVGRLFKTIQMERAGTLPREIGVRLSRDIADALRAVGEKAASLPTAQRTAVDALLRDIAGGVRLAGQMSDFSAMVQLPVVIGGRAETAELYVFSDSRKRDKINPKNATLFLSLGTARIGRVETLVKVIGKNVECDFKLESRDWADFARASSGRLAALLEASGFLLTRSSFAEAEEKTAGPLAVREARERFSGRYTFDAQI